MADISKAGSEEAELSAGKMHMTRNWQAEPDWLNEVDISFERAGDRIFRAIGSCQPLFGWNLTGAAFDLSHKLRQGHVFPAASKES